jgi:hypothetical protein
MALPIKPSTFLQGVGLTGTCEILDAHYSVFDFNGKATAQPALTLKVKTEGGKEQIQHYPVGSLVAVAPSQDGESPAMDDNSEYGIGPYLCAQKDNITALFGDSDFAFLMTHLVNAGFPESKMPDDGDARFLIGLVSEFGPAPKKYTDQSGTEKSRTVAVPLKVVRLPGEKAKGAGATASAKASGSKAANGAAQTGAATPEQIDELAMTALMSALEASGGAVDINDKSVSQLLLKPLLKSPTAQRAQAVLRAKNPEFLNSMVETGVVVYDGAAGIVSLAA